MPVSEPHGKGYYVVVATFALLAGLAFLWKAVARMTFTGRPLNTPVVWRLVEAGCGAILLLGALQALERRLAPARAQSRSAAFSDVARRRLLLLSRVLGSFGVAACISDFVVHAIWWGHGGYTVFWGVLILAGYFLAELCG